MTDLGKVRERMVDLEDHHEIEINVQEVLAKLLGHDDPEALGETAISEVNRALILMSTTYNRLGLPVTPPNVAAVAFLQGVTFAVAYRQITEET